MNIQHIIDRVAARRQQRGVVTRIEETSTGKTIVILPEGKRQPIGDKWMNLSSTIKVGDTVIFERNCDGHITTR